MERQKVMENVKELKQKKSIIEYRYARERWQEMNKKKKEACSILSEARKHLHPVETSIADVEKQVGILIAYGISTVHSLIVTSLYR